MKTCSTCGATYTDRIDFCFEDGAVLAVQARGSMAPAVQPDPPAASDTADAFDAPLPPPRLVRAQEEEALPAQAEQTPPPPDAATGPSVEEAPPVRKRRSLLPGAAPAAAPAPAAAAQGPAAPAPAAPLATITPPQPEVAEVEYEEEVPTPEPRSAPKPPDPNRPLSPSQDGANDPPWIEPVDAPAAASSAPASAGPSRPASPSADLARSSGRGASAPPAPADEEEPARGRPAWMIPVAILGVIALVGGGFFAVAALGLGGAALTSASHEGEEPAPVRPTVVPVPTAPGSEAAVEPTAGDTDIAAILDTDAAAVAPPIEEGGATEGTAEEAVPAAPASSPSVAVPAPTPGSGGSGSVVAAGSSTSAAATAAPAPAAAQIGKVSFDSSPAGATVWIGGAKKGVTPLTVDLPYGDHQVKIELAGHSAVEKSVKVGAAEVKVPSVALEAEIKIGKVFVALPGRDGQTLYVDGRKIGPLPASIDLTEGTHAFSVEAPDGTRIEVSRDVAFTDGRAFISL